MASYSLIDDEIPPRKSINRLGSTQRGRRARRRESENADRKQEQPFKGAAAAAAETQDVPETALPDPIPADELLTPSIKRTTLIVPPTFPVSPTTSSVLVSSDLPLRTTTLWVTETPSSSPTNKSDSATAPTHSPGHLPSYFVALAIGGSVVLALAIVFVLKCIFRKKHKSHPTPSNPILQDSPLFGGKERFSRNLWGESSLGNILYTGTANAKNDGWRPLSGATATEMGKMSEMRQSMLLTVPQSAAASSTAPPPFSPASVYTSAAPAVDIGVALEHFPLPNNAAVSGTQPLKLKEKEREAKTVRRRSVVASTTFDTAGTFSPTITETETAVAYSAPRPAPSPGKPKPALKTSGSSRDRMQGSQRKNDIPSPALQGALPRRASRSGDMSMADTRKRESFLYAIPSVKSQERRDRDTKALTSALGLGSPQPPPSSCFSPVSLYPDDSLSVVDAGRALGRRPISEAPVSEMPSPTGTTAALGDLMLQDFPSTATFASLRAGDPFADGVGTSSGMSAKKKGYGYSRGVSDKPPRVPSPPPLPSLAQMALERSDSEYRSPTYSIYGLYEAERKSKMSLAGK